PTRLHRFRPLIENVGCARRPRSLVVAFDEQPVLTLLPRLTPHPHQMPSPGELLAVELEVQMAFGIALMRIPDGSPTPPVPKDDRTAAVLALGDRALEVAILERMVFGVDGKPLFAGNETWSLGHRPALEDTVEFQPEVIVKPPRRVLLHHEA